MNDIKKHPFCVKDCSLAAIATGIKAENLQEFKEELKTIAAESIYYHFWRQSIETSLIQGSFHNDFSHWAHYHFSDDFLAERLALIDPSDYEDLEKLRSKVLSIVEQRCDELQDSALKTALEPFYFIKSKIVIFNTPYKMEQPKDLVKIIPEMSRSSIFYHFVESRRRKVIEFDDFSSWLTNYGDEFQDLIEKFKQIDPYFVSLDDLQQRLSLEVTDYFLNSK